MSSTSGGVDMGGSRVVAEGSMMGGTVVEKRGVVEMWSGSCVVSLGVVEYSGVVVRQGLPRHTDCCRLQ